MGSKLCEAGGVRPARTSKPFSVLAEISIMRCSVWRLCDMYIVVYASSAYSAARSLKASMVVGCDWKLTEERSNFGQSSTVFSRGLHLQFAKCGRRPTQLHQRHDREHVPGYVYDRRL